ncbi:Type II secretion system protein M [Rubrivivax sp. A210]|uniref:type II secretion system protein GspM n=1 Tax=Rubrivivax sp. A210 TaxID=2772301 RepID=UPI001919529C|nr:type II secretion system protein GspM [Rubrivivax sp. A210]CAD5372566.1 Type II secretion system protein M [Rubrivivax sp. A210]
MSENSVQPWLAPIAAWWRGLASRERTGLALAGAALALYALLALAVLPAWRSIARAPLELDALETQLQTMQRLAAEAQQLRAAAPVSAEQAAAALKAATARLGDKARLTLQADRAVLMINGVSTGQLRDWLAEARSGARARPVEANFVRGANGHTGTLVLAFGGGA